MSDEDLPIIIMVLLLLSSNIYGVLGTIVAIPTYSILKEIAKLLTNLYDNHKEAQQQKKNEELGIDWFQSLDTRNKTEEGPSVLFHYVFKSVFLVEKNKKTTSLAGGCQGFELSFLFPSIIYLFR